MKDIQIMDVDPTTREVTFVTKPRLLSGISKLVQIVVLSLMNVSGRDVLDPEKGGGLPSLIGINVDPLNSSSLFGEIARDIKKSESEIISDQLASSDPPEEKLKELQIINIGQGTNIDEIFIKVRVINQVNQSINIMV